MNSIKAQLNTRTHFDLVSHIIRQRDFSLRTFGPGDRAGGIGDHIAKEMLEVIDAYTEHGPGAPEVLKEWVDVILLALDGAWRAGFSAAEIAGAIEAKQRINEERRWPDWRTAELGKAIEHDRAGEQPLEPGALVAFLGQAKAFRIKTIGKSSEMEKYVELEELPGQFAPHLFRRLTE